MCISLHSLINNYYVHPFRYNMEDSNVNDTNFETLDQSKVADVLLVKKHYGDRSTRRKNRIWKLKHLTNEEPAFDTETKLVTPVFLSYFCIHKLCLLFSDYHEFLDELEEDPDMRQNINIFKDSSKPIPVDANDQNDFNDPRITLEEMLDDLVIEDEDMQECYE